MNTLCYVFMAYPKKSEIFGRVEIRSLIGAGVDVSVAAYKVGDSINGEHEGDEVFFPSWLENIKSVLFLLLNVGVALKMLWFLFKVSSGAHEFLKSFYLSVPALSIARHIKAKDFDAVYLFWGHYPSLVLYALREIAYHKRVAVFTGAYDLVGNTGIMKWGVNNADTVFSHAQCNLTQIQSFYQGHVNVVYRGVDCSLLRTCESAKRSKDVAFAGRLIKSKRADLAILFFDKYKNKYKDAKLHIFGEGPEKDSLLELAGTLGLGSDVIFHGHVAQRYMFDSFHRSSFFVFPSEHDSERLPNSVKEAMLFGCIPIVGYTHGIDELVENDVSGIVGEFSDIESLFSRVESLLRIPNGFEDMSSNASGHIQSKFDNEKLAKERAGIIFGGK